MKSTDVVISATPMIRKAFIMTVNDGAEAEYVKRHCSIPASLHEVLKSHGVHNYSIFLLHDTRQLFAYAEIEDQARWEAIASTPACQSWWQFMAELMPHQADFSPITVDALEVFHLP